MSAQSISLSPKSHRDNGRTPLLSSPVLGMLIFVVMEMMFFSALISSFSIIKAGALFWPPPQQPRLPIEATAFNTLILITSAIFLFFANKAFAKPELRARAQKLLLLCFLSGSLFVLIQGFEWVRLIGYGLTMTSSTYGSFFYLIIGSHALHVISALIVLLCCLIRFKKKTVTPAFFHASQVFWYFVVGVWPILYILVYLS